MIEPLPLPLSSQQLDHIRTTRGDDPDIASLIQEITRLQALCDDVEDALFPGAGRSLA